MEDENSKDHQARQSMASCLDTFVQETNRKYMAAWAEESAKLQAARRNREKYEELTDEKGYFKVNGGARLKLEKGNCSCYAVHCEGRRSRKPQTCTISNDARTEPSDSENTGACGKVKRQHMDHMAEKGMWEVFTTSANSYSRSCEDTRSQSRSG